jgi:FixJ family two-component response regulator
VTREKLLETVERALARHTAIAAEDSKISALRDLYDQLTPRERDVFALLVRGRPHKQIAYELKISDRTVKLHRHQIVQKLRVRSLAEFAVIAERLGLLPKPEQN